MNQETLTLFEAPLDLIDRDVAVLTCGDRVYLDPTPARLKDGWYAAVHCFTCNRKRQVVSVIYPARREP